MPADFPTLRAHVAAETAGLTARLEDVGEADWQRPTACADWTVADVMAHIATGASFQVETLSRGLAGDTSPLFGDPAARAAQVEERRGRPGAVVLAEFRANMDALLALFDRLTPADLERPAWHVSGIHPIRWFVEQRLGELAIHRLDVQQALGDDHQIAPVVGDLLVDGYFDRLPRLLDGQAAGDLQATVEFRVGGSPPHRRALHVANGRATLTDAADATPDLVFEGDAVTYLLLTTGRLHPRQARAAGRLRIRGDERLVERWRELFRTL
jgi:uncharacterized protein (TIGR03083 family)